MKLCKPYRSPLQAMFIMVFTAIFVLLSAYMIPYFPDLAIYLRLTGGMFLFLGAYLLFRYTLTEFVYALSDGVFSVHRIIGLGERRILTLELTEKTELYTKKEFKRIKTKGGKSYRQNLTAATAFFVYEHKGEKRYIEFEPNAEFYAILKKAIEDKKE